MSVQVTSGSQEDTLSPQISQVTLSTRSTKEAGIKTKLVKLGLPKAVMSLGLLLALLVAAVSLTAELFVRMEQDTVPTYF